MRVSVHELKNSAVLYIYSIRSKIKIDPEYQRTGEIWTLDKKQLLIDTILNDFDVPKLYFHDLRDFDKKSKYDFAIVDGRQRLEAIWDFIDGKFALSDEFELLDDPKVKLAGMTYQELGKASPSLKQLFDASSLSIMVVKTDDRDLIEEMFSRLNEAVPLNAAEKRNAFGGVLPKLARQIAEHQFFKEKIKISNKRYQHRDIAAKMLYLIHKNGIFDTKKVYLDSFFRDHRDTKEKSFSATEKKIRLVLAGLSKVFADGDKLLRSTSMVMLYFLLFDYAISNSFSLPSRNKLLEFEEKRSKNRAQAEKDITKADYELLEFDRLTQTPNDAFAVRLRFDVLKKFVYPNL